MPIIELDDRDLMLSLKNGDTGSLELLHRRHRTSVQRLIRRMTGNAAVAEELSQEVFLRVYQARERYEPTASFSTWLYRIAFNRSLNWIRSQNQHRNTTSFDAQPNSFRRLQEPGATPERKLLDKEHVERIREVINSLPPRQRQALILHKYEGLDYTQIAVRMNTTVPAIKSLLFRTYLSLQDLLRPLTILYKTPVGKGQERL
jgi:RNA polymerase sigma-70 factor (ECF subfamily)